MSTEIITGRVRFSYVNIFQPRVNDDGTEKYQIALLIPKSDTATIKAINSGIKAAFESEKGRAKLAGKTLTQKSFKHPLKDGDDEGMDPAAAGCMVINASSKDVVPVLTRERKPLMNKSDLYSGCYGRAIVNFYPFNVDNGKSFGIGAGLQSLQKLSDGEPLGAVFTEDMAVKKFDDGYADEDEEYDDI